MKKTKVTLFYNANIITMNPEMPVAEKLLVKGDKIVRVGSKDSGFTEYDSKVDLKGKTVIPGFNDSHLHLKSIGEAMETVDLTTTRSLEDIQVVLKDYIEKEGGTSGDWVIGRGWNQNNYPKQKLPDKKLIDKVAPDRPVILKRACGHIVLVNSKALSISGVDKYCSDPPGGTIDRNPETGEPTGILRENAIGLVESRIPEATKYDYKRWIKRAASELIKWGLTSVQSDDFGNLNRFRVGYRAYKDLKQAGELPLRVNLQVRMGKQTDFKNFVNEYGLKTGDGDNRLKVGPCKILADGSMGGRTAALIKPYSDQTETRGALIYEPEELREYILYADKAGFQTAVHGIGDRCISTILDIYEEMLERKNLSLAEAGHKFRPRLIHGQLTNETLLARIKKLNIGVDVQPIFLNADLHIAEDRVGPERLKGAYAWKTIIEQGINLAGGSDGPVDSYKPFDGIYSAVTRKDLDGYPDGGWLPDEALSVKEALRIYTLGSAFNSFEENIKGSLEKGKLADFVVLNKNPLSVEAEYLNEIQVLATYMGSKKVYG